MVIDLDTETLPLVALIVGAYLVGSIPFGIIITRILGLGDLRKIGSGNIGATNVLRTGNKLAGLSTVLLDAGKGAFAVLVSAALFGPQASLFAALFVFLGHLYPIWLRFRGGKGVATYLGVLLALSFFVGVATCLTWLFAFICCRISSVGAILAAILAPVWMFFIEGSENMALIILISLWILLRHKQNFVRLISGTEPKVHFKKKTITNINNCN